MQIQTQVRAKSSDGWNGRIDESCDGRIAVEYGSKPGFHYDADS
jgi:hypothetical protein